MPLHSQSFSYVRQGELEHRRLKRRYPRSGKKKNSMVASIANQEAIERFVRKFNEARQVLNQERQPKRRVRTSPSDHYYIAESSRMSDNLTAWLAERRGDLAFDVSCSVIVSEFTRLIRIRIFSLVSRIIYSHVSSVWSTTAMNMTSRMKTGFA